MSTFLLALHDAGGTVPPMMAIAAELTARRHDVLVLGQPSVRDRTESVGARFEPFSTLPDYDHTRPFEDQLELVGPAMVGPEVGEDVLAFEADAYVVDANLAGALSAAESVDAPSVALLHSLRRTYQDVWFGELWPLLHDAVSQTRAGFGLEPVASWDDLFGRQTRQWSVVPSVFDVNPQRPAGNHVHLGWTVPFAPPVDAPAGHPLVLVSMSTTSMGDAALVQSIFDRLAELPVNGIATLADRVGRAGLRVPANVALLPATPHAALLPHVDVVVTHAGLGTVAAALAHGVPLVCTPIERDQPLNAELVAGLGAGVVGLDGLERVIDEPSFRANAESLRGNVGANTAANDLERVVASDHA